MDENDNGTSSETGPGPVDSKQHGHMALDIRADGRPVIEAEKRQSSHEAIFKVTAAEDCPFHALGDEFKVSGHALFLQPKKENQFIANIIVKSPARSKACRAVISDLAKVSIDYERVSLIPDMVITCAQCHGAITLEHKRSDAIGLVEDFNKHGKDIDTIVSLLRNFSIFKTLSETHLKEFVTFFRLKKFSPNTCVIRQGDPGRFLYIILTGSVDVLSKNGKPIAQLSDGEVFGEMSLISGGPAGATIYVAKPTTALFINGQDFLHALKNYPTLQMYFARLISKRLSDSKEFASIELFAGSTGRLDQMPPMKIVQTINYKQMTGVLKLTFNNGLASLIFREGKIVGAEYNKMEGKSAFFKILGENKGRFIFTPGLTDSQMLLPELGMFMELLFEALRILDMN